MRFWRNTAVAHQRPIKLGHCRMELSGMSGTQKKITASGRLDCSISRLLPIHLTNDYLLGLWWVLRCWNRNSPHVSVSGCQRRTSIWCRHRPVVMGTRSQSRRRWQVPHADINMQQATVNLFADMGVQPATLQSGLVVASTSTDTVPPSSTITSPAPGVTFQPFSCRYNSGHCLRCGWSCSRSGSLNRWWFYLASGQRTRNAGVTLGLSRPRAR